MQKEFSKKIANVACISGALVLSFYGIYAFFNRAFPQKLFGEASFDAFAHDDTFLQFFVDYFCIAVLFFCLAFLIKKKFPR